MNLSIIEEAVLYNALKKYRFYCKGCLENQENGEQTVFIQGDLDLIDPLMEKINRDYISQGGPASRLSTASQADCRAVK